MIAALGTVVPGIDATDWEGMGRGEAAGCVEAALRDHLAGAQGRVELGAGIQATCTTKAVPAHPKESSDAANDSSKKADLSSLGSMLQARWKGAAPRMDAKPEPVSAGQIREFRITNLDAASKKIEVELVS